MCDPEYIGGELNYKIAKLEKRVSELEKLIRAMYNGDEEYLLGKWLEDKI